MTKFFSAVVWALVIPGLGMAATRQAGTNGEQRIDALEQQVQSYLREQKPELAVPVLRQIILLDPKNLNANANLGVLLFFQNNYAEALPPMRTALQSKPDLWRIQALVGIAEKRTGDPVAAEKDLQQSFSNLEDRKIQKQAGLELVELDSSFGQLAKAAAVTERLEEILPQDPQVLFTAWRIASQMMDQTLLNMLLVAPESAEMHMIIGGQLGREGDHVNAVAQYRKAVRLNPHLPGVHFELAQQLSASPDPAMNAQAEGEYKAAVQENQYDVKAWSRLGDSVAARGDFKTAERDYRKALAVQPKDSDAETGLAIALISMNRIDQAIPLLESAVRNDPTNIAAHYRLSIIYRRVGRTADAEREMSEFKHYNDLKVTMGHVFQQIRVQPDKQ
ncbi:MAG TPA: tetratricopeptide repeat protein [Acidobacteriaceae bacterium]|nr:tetratricopeptide repeat protein [Acidobacteriaceae bacterium]